MQKDELIKRLIDLDLDAQLTFLDDTVFKCYIVGGSALVLMGYSIRSTHDIDVLERYPKEISTLFDKYDMNTDVVAYMDSFPMGFEERARLINVPTKKVQFYTLSLEDIVISKLCTTRGKQDLLDINSENIIKDIDWEHLEELAQIMKDNKISGIETFDYYYKEYIDKYRK